MKPHIESQGKRPRDQTQCRSYQLASLPQTSTWLCLRALGSKAHTATYGLMLFLHKIFLFMYFQSLPELRVNGKSFFLVLDLVFNQALADILAHRDKQTLRKQCYLCYLWSSGWRDSSAVCVCIYIYIFPEDQGQFPELKWQSRAICTTSSRGYGTLFWPLPVFCARDVGMSIHIK